MFRTIFFALVFAAGLCAQTPAVRSAEIVGLPPAPSAVDVTKLEEQIARDPQDVDTRIKLMQSYGNTVMGQRANPDQGALNSFLTHWEWMIRNRPESFALQSGYTSFIGTWRSRPELFQRGEQLWMEQTQVHAADPRVLTNAAAFLRSQNPQAALTLLNRAYQLTNGEPAVAAQLGSFYGMEITSEDANRVAAAKAALANSNDPAVYGGAGGFLVGWARRDPANKMFAAQILERAVAARPENLQFKTALENVRNPGSQTPGAIRVGGNVQQANLLRQVPPEYPALAKQARVQGIVRFNVTIEKDGTVSNVQLVSGHPLLIQAATDSVKQWVYKTTLLNGEPVRVLTTVDVNFTLTE